eukprot:5546345-Pyramimonas_sp.AAC.2
MQTVSGTGHIIQCAHFSHGSVEAVCSQVPPEGSVDCWDCLIIEGLLWAASVALPARLGRASKIAFDIESQAHPRLLRARWGTNEEECT